MSYSEVKIPVSGKKLPDPPKRGTAGRFSGLAHVFSSDAAQAVLKKYALLDEGNGSEMLAKLFRKSNFGYGKSKAEPWKAMTNAEGSVRWSDTATGGTGLADSYGAGPSPLTSPV